MANPTPPLLSQYVCAVTFSQALNARLSGGTSPLTIHWSGCPAGCGNHQAADIGLRGFKTKIDGKLVDAVAVYAGGRTGPHACGEAAAKFRRLNLTAPCGPFSIPPMFVPERARRMAGKEILATVPCDENFPEVIANLIQSYREENECAHDARVSDPLFTAAATVGLASWRPSGSFVPSAATA